MMASKLGGIHSATAPRPTAIYMLVPAHPTKSNARHLLHRKRGDPLCQCARVSAPRNYAKTFEDCGAVPIERSVWMNQSRSEFHAHLAGHVLNHDRGDLGGASKAPDGLENLQLHQQCHLGRRGSRNRGRPLVLIKTRAEKLMQFARSQRIR